MRIPTLSINHSSNKFSIPQLYILRTDFFRRKSSSVQENVQKTIGRAALLLCMKPFYGPSTPIIGFRFKITQQVFCRPFFASKWNVCQVGGLSRTLFTRTWKRKEKKCEEKWMNLWARFWSAAKSGTITLHRAADKIRRGYTIKRPY